MTATMANHAILSNIPHRTFSFPSSQEHKCSFNHTSTRKLSVNSPYRPESQRKHALAPWRPFGASTTSQDPTSKSNDGYSSNPRCSSMLSTNEETTTLEKTWGSLFDEDCQPTVRLGQLLRGLTMHIVRLGSRGLQSHTMADDTLQFATHRSVVVDASASSYPQTPTVILLSTSKSLRIKMPRKRGVKRTRTY